jgi:hypothetical protein
VQRRIRKIQEPLHYLSGYASIFPNIADRYVWIDALAGQHKAAKETTAGACRKHDIAVPGSNPWPEQAPGVTLG